MKKSLLALAVLGAFAGAAAAQSSVTIYGVVDVNAGKDAGSDDKRLGQGAQSRLGFRGVEDLGNGLRATFNIQHRFDSGTGVAQGTPGASSTSPFWQAEANVGLAGNFGNVRAGRQYTESFYQQYSADPWGYDTVATLSGFTGGGVAGTRNNNSISYWITASGITFGAQIAETSDNTGGGGNAATPGSVVPATAKRPVNVRLQYSAGPLLAGVSFENPALEGDDWTFVNGAYDFGAFKLGAFVGSGSTAGAGTASLDRQSVGLTATAPYGQGQARLGFAQLKGPSAAAGADILQRQRISAGYHYSLSKRTTIYGDVASDSTDRATLPSSTNGKDSDTGYDFGIKHVF